MTNHPIIINIIAADVHRRVRWQSALLLTLTLMTAAVTIWIAVRSGGEVLTVSVTSGLLLVLAGNLLMMFYRSQIEKNSKSLFIAPDRCYTVTENEQVHECMPIRLQFGRQSVLIDPMRAAGSPGLLPGRVTTFRILDQQDWKALKKHSGHWSTGHDNNTLPSVFSTLAKNAAL